MSVSSRQQGPGILQPTASRLQPVHCAVYTRKSHEDGLEQDFNSLDAQREACEAFIRSQAARGWELAAGHYDDGGFSGGTMERPALKRLLMDVDAGAVDTIVVYKIDRLSRSLLDFFRMVVCRFSGNWTIADFSKRLPSVVAAGSIVRFLRHQGSFNRMWA